jgi:hypothetical protein
MNRRDTGHLLNLLMRGDFRRIWLSKVEERNVRVCFEHRHQLMQVRTRAKNGCRRLRCATGCASEASCGPGRAWKRRRSCRCLRLFQH